MLYATHQNNAERLQIALLNGTKVEDIKMSIGSEMNNVLEKKYLISQKVKNVTSNLQRTVGFALERGICSLHR